MQEFINVILCPVDKLPVHKEDKNLFTLAGCVVLMQIWQTRNAVVFMALQVSILDVVQRAVRRIENVYLAQQVCRSGCVVSLSNCALPLAMWNPSFGSMFKANVDAAGRGTRGCELDVFLEVVL